MSYESLTLADLKELATTIHIKEYGTKADIIGRIKAHPVGPSLLNKLETSKKKEKEEQKDNGKLFEIKDKLTPQFCSEFNLKFLGELPLCCFQWYTSRCDVSCRRYVPHQRPRVLVLAPSLHNNSPRVVEKNPNMNRLVPVPVPMNL